MQPVHTIASFAKPQPDTIAAIFLLKKFGEALFPGVSGAQLAFWSVLPEGKTATQLEEEGYILIDLGQGRFDHHAELSDGRPQRCSSELVAEFLQVTTHPPLQKLLAYAKRDDLEGKGTISPDALDRAFGLSGLLTNLNRTYSHDPAGIVNMVLAMFEAHYQEEENRTIIVKQEWKDIQAANLQQTYTAVHKNIHLRIVQLPSDNLSIAGFLRNYHGFDIVVLRRTTGHVNIITNQKKPFSLAGVAEQIRSLEAQKLGLSLEKMTLRAQGRIESIPHWYYDTVANTLQNGGINPQDTVATTLSDLDIRNALVNGLQNLE